MPTEGIGVYALGTAALLNDEISSTYEGRHLTFLEADITGHEHAFPTKGHPVVVSNTAAPDFGHIVGVALTTATAIGDLVAIDTEGIWYLSVSANVGHGPITHGDDLYIDRNSAIISNDLNKNTHTHFGYALGGVAEGEVATIAVKVHWGPDDAEEKVGVSGTEYASAMVSKHFRDYYYKSTGGSYIEGEHFELVIPSDSARVYSVAAKSIVLTIPGDEWRCTGMVAGLEVILNVTAGSANMGTWGILTLDLNNLNTMGMPSHAAAYIVLREHSLVLGDTQMQAIFDFMDITAGPAHATNLFCASATANDSHKLKFMVGGVHYWLVVSDTAPD